MGSYYDVDAILTDAQVGSATRSEVFSWSLVLIFIHPFQKVPCTFDVTVPGLGYMEGNPGGDVCIMMVEATI